MTRKTFITPAQAASAFATEEEVTTGALALHGSSLTTDGVITSDTGADLELQSPSNQDVRTAPGSGRAVFDSGDFTTAGDAESARWVLRNETADATPAKLYADGSSTQLDIPAGKVLSFEALIVAKGNTGSNADSAGLFWFRGLIKNISGTTTLIGEINDKDSEVAGWSVSVSADDTNDALDFTVTGDAGTVVRWVAYVTTAEVSS